DPTNVHSNGGHERRRRLPSRFEYRVIAHQRRGRPRLPLVLGVADDNSRPAVELQVGPQRIQPTTEWAVRIVDSDAGGTEDEVISVDVGDLYCRFQCFAAVDRSNELQYAVRHGETTIRRHRGRRAVPFDQNCTERAVWLDDAVAR